MNKLFGFCTLLLPLTQVGQLRAQHNLLMGIANDNSTTFGGYNTSYGWLDNIGGGPDYPTYTKGNRNTFIGANTGNYSNGSDNTTLGFNTGGWYLSGSQNVFIGADASGNNIYKYQGGNGNITIGVKAGFYNQADYNVFMGTQSGYSNSTGGKNVFVGTSTGYANTEGTYNTLMGYQAGKNNTTGSDNTFLGNGAGQINTTGDLNTFVGSLSGYTNTTGRLNAFLGYAVGQHNTTGAVNVFMGSFAGTANTTGQRNTFLGSTAGPANTTGSYNVYTGYRSGDANTTGYSNVAVGVQTAFKNLNGHNNVAIGDSAGYNATASANTFVGSKAGYTNQTGTQNTLLGYQADVKSASLSNAAAIGANARVSVSNAIVLGDSVVNTKVGIGLTAPQFALDVRGIINIRGNGTLKFSQLSNPRLRQGGTDQFLTVNEAGETVLARYQLRIRDVTQWSDQVFSPAYTLRPLASVATYIGQHGHLPGIPSASEVVDKGIDLVKMNTTLLEKVEELTLYSIQQQKEIDEQKAALAELKQLVRQLVGKK